MVENVLHLMTDLLSESKFKMLENTVWEVEFNLPKGNTGLQFSDITSNVPKNHQWLNRAASNNVLMVYKGQTKG